jgi:CheY-like chemotaxis protein
VTTDDVVILVVDDNSSNLKLVSFLLVKEGYRVRSAASAEEGLVSALAEPPAVILMDIQLPGMDGLALTRLLKSDPRTHDSFIVAFTAFAMKGDERAALDAGCDAYLTKPFDTRSFAATMRDYLARRASSRGALTP